MDLSDSGVGQRNPNHQLIAGKHPILYRLSSICLVVQNFATIHSYQHRGVRDNPMQEMDTVMVVYHCFPHEDCQKST